LPPAAEVLRHVERPWIDHLDSWTMQHGCATHNMFCYGREIGNIVSTIAVYVLLDTPAQRELATRFIQLGIDNYGVVKSGGGWGSDGGHFNGRKWPIVFAGGMLNNAGMTFVSRVMTATGKTLADVVAAYLSVDVAAGASPTREKVVASPKPAEAQHGALLKVEEAIEAATRESANGGRIDAAALQQRMHAEAGAS
jgi:hypothetical protein